MYRELDELLVKAKQGDVNSKEEILNRLQGLIIKKIQRYYNKREEYKILNENPLKPQKVKNVHKNNRKN